MAGGVINIPDLDDAFVLWNQMEMNYCTSISEEAAT
jgi:hypothetical protein